MNIPVDMNKQFEELQVRRAKEHQAELDFAEAKGIVPGTIIQIYRTHAVTLEEKPVETWEYIGNGWVLECHDDGTRTPEGYILFLVGWDHRLGYGERLPQRNSLRNIWRHLQDHRDDRDVHDKQRAQWGRPPRNVKYNIRFDTKW